MPFLNGFNASVVVQQDRALNTYGIVIDEAQRVLTCWIPYEAGRYYKVVWGCQKRFMESRGDVYIDGYAVGSEIIRYEYKVKLDKHPSVVEKDRSTLANCEPEPFTFPLQVKEEDNEHAMDTSTQATNKNAHQGEIRLVIHRISAHSKAALLNNPTLEDNIERIATFVFKYRSMDYLKKNSIDRQTTAIIPLRLMDSGVPANQGNIKSEPVDVEMGDVDDDEMLDSKIREAQGQLNALYATKIEKERKLPKPARHRKPKILRTPSARQKLEEEIRKLPKSLRVRARQAALEGLVYARMHCPSDLSVNPQAPEIVEKKPKKPKNPPKQTRSSLRIREGQIASEIQESIKSEDQSTDLNESHWASSTST
ncbi:hypothetical protein BDN70DRAFT_878603 [Pholiota conissans]|uniref:Uncharacterized protein n=1 Tax=Pholiota conissans TaxID=109636 RepID=A0A9P5Z3Y2_9AGAR|nr:hypothetical protein BDN70DRAFT_878603 [Pholiota conissans]